MEGFTITKMLDLPAQKVWAIASDFTKFPGPAISVQVEEKGSPELNGVGTVRTIIIGRVQVRERLESVNPPKPFTYRILSGAPMKDYLGTVKISSRVNRPKLVGMLNSHRNFREPDGLLEKLPKIQSIALLTK